MKRSDLAEGITQETIQSHQHNKLACPTKLCLCTRHNPYQRRSCGGGGGEV